MQKITDILNFPDGTPIDAIQGRISEVYAYEKKTGQKGPYTLQKAYIADVGGNKIKLTVWDHPDLAPLKGNEYVLHNTGGTRYPGIKVRIGSYVATKDGQQHKAGDTVKTLELNVTKNGCFQHVEVFNQNKPAGATPATPVSKPVEAQIGGQVGGSAQSAYINGQTVGMAINNAVKIICEGAGYNPETFSKQLHVIASDIIRISQTIEKGNLAGGTPKTVEAKPEPAKTVPVASPEQDEDVPF